jgi:hypothetical protein
MKRIAMICFVLTASTVTMFAQGMQVKKTMKLPQDEVPALVRTAFEKDFGSIPENGQWTVFYKAIQEGGKTTANPLWYTYSNKSTSGKIEVSYLPNGKVKNAKGIERKDAAKKLEKQSAESEKSTGR